MVSKEDLNLLKELSGWTSPLIEVGYCETGINTGSKKCWAVGYLLDFHEFFPYKEVILAPILREPWVYSIAELESKKKDTPTTIAIPLDAIFCVRKLVREGPILKPIDLFSKKIQKKKTKKR